MTAPMTNTDISMPQDKLLHLLTGCAIAGTLHPFGLPIAVLALTVVGLGKEVYDRVAHGTVDVYDFMATVWGGAVTLVQINAMLVPHG